MVSQALDRWIRWEGFYNARDLGGLVTSDGRVTRCRALIRSADLRFVTDAGWQAAREACVRTIIDLRNDDEIRPDTGHNLTALGGTMHFPPDAAGPVVPDGMRREHVPLDDAEDVGFWRMLNLSRLNGTPLYYRRFLEHKADRCAAAVAAVARAAPGGVIIHCGAGRDRTGLLTLLLLAVLNVTPDAIAADYELSIEPLRSLAARMGRADEGPAIARILAEHRTTAREAVLAIVERFDAETYLRSAGLGTSDFAALRQRLLEPLEEGGQAAGAGR
jgi:hypothetical protein